MCCRFGLELENVSPLVVAGMETLNGKGIHPASGDVRPNDLALVFANNRRMEISPFAMSWGFHSCGKSPVINARSETAAEKRSFSECMERHRCMIPASCYYEWRRTEEGKRKYRVWAKDRDGFYLAGLYRMEKEGFVFTVLTREPDESVAFLHDRMPVLLPEEAMKDWLDVRSDAGEVIRSAGVQLCCSAC